MAVSKKHMEWAARYLRDGRAHQVAKPYVVEAFARFFEAYNERFDKARFERACNGVPCSTCGGGHNCRCQARSASVARHLKAGK